MNAIAKEIQATKDFQLSQNPTRAIEGAVSRRAQLLADRIERGADVLASFVAGLSETEWNTPVSATDRRSIRVIVHHVASVYPIEIELAKTIAGGKAITDLSWAAVAELNAKHAHENSRASKASALELLHKNSREAASSVRCFTDDGGRTFLGQIRHTSLRTQRSPARPGHFV